MDIGGISNRPGAQSVNDAIHGAATATGANFEYLLATAQAESGLNSQAVSPTSSARGLYQFIDQTWLATLKSAGPGLGYGKYADAIVQNASGHFDVPDPAMRRDIMALRYDPTANAAMAGALTKSNAATLAGGLGRKASDGELYIAHVLGSSGAVKLTSLAVTNPGTAADAVFPAAAEANRSVFYDRQGRPRSVLDVYGALVGRYDGARNPSRAASGGSSGASFNPASNTAAPAVAPATAGAPLVIVPGVPTTDPVPTSAVAGTAATAIPDASGQASSGPLFNGLFSDRSAPISQVVQDLWAPRGPSLGSPAPSSAASLVSASGTRELFQPQSTDAAGLFGR
jgi:hypothetical protein